MRTPVAVMERPFGRYPKGHPKGGRFRRKVRRVVFEQRNVKRYERLGFKDCGLTARIAYVYAKKMEIEFLKMYSYKPPTPTRCTGIDWFRYEQLEKV